MAVVNKPDIFAYLEYRVFLRDAFAALKAASPRLSYRYFAGRAGYTSPNFLQMVIQGKRSLNSTRTIATAKALKLNKEETEFFRCLVGYDQARSPDEKNLFYQKISGNKRCTSIKALEKDQHDFFSQWYVPVVRELLVHREYTGDINWIAERIFPRITPAQAEQARDWLHGAGLIVWDAEAGRWRLADPVVRTASEASYAGLRTYHEAALRLAQSAMRDFVPEDRDIRSVTLGVSRAAIPELKSRMENFWNAVLDFAGQIEDADTVYQVNMQLFPLVKEDTKDHG